MRSSVCSALTTAAIVHGLSTDHDRRRGQRCTVLTHPVSLIHRGIFVQMNRATSLLLCTTIYTLTQIQLAQVYVNKQGLCVCVQEIEGQIKVYCLDVYAFLAYFYRS